MNWILMCVITVAVLAVITPWMISCSDVQKNDNSDTLVLLHVLFRHGHRTPDLHEVYPKHSKAEGGLHTEYGHLTKKGQIREYLIGKTLRSKYDHFLGLYEPDAVSAKSTDYIRTRASCLLVLAGLYPPSKEQLWDDDILWQPIPYDYEAYDTDKVLGDPLKHCPPFKHVYDKFPESAEGQKFYKNNKEIYDYLSENTGWDIKTPKLVYDLYFTLKAEEEMGIKLPEWTKSVWPTNITNLAADEYDAQASSPEMLRIAAGFLLEKILNDSDLKLKGELSPERKIFLYSAHEYNIAFLLKALGVFEPHIPPFGSYLIFEVHNINGVNGFKILYQDYESSPTEPKLLQLANCDSFCPVHKFKELMKKYIPLPLDCID